MFPEAENLSTIKNHNEAINTSSDYSNLSRKEEEETWLGFGDDGNLINESRPGKAKVQGLSLNEVIIYINTPIASVKISK